MDILFTVFRLLGVDRLYMLMVGICRYDNVVRWMIPEYLIYLLNDGPFIHTYSVDLQYPLAYQMFIVLAIKRKYRT